MVDRLVNSEVNHNRIANVENCFGISGVPLNIPGRVLVGEGILTKMCRKKPKPRQFFLFNDILVYGNIVLKGKKYSRQHIIPLEEVKLEDLKDDDAMQNGWLIKTPTKSFAVYAATNTEKQEWMQHIQRCVDELIKRTGKQPTGEHAAVWVPDAEARRCMHCNKSEFSLLNRRHHCRSCGAVICGACSKHKFLIPTQSSKPVRVCDTCFDKLSKGRTGIRALPEETKAPEIEKVAAVDVTVADNQERKDDVEVKVPSNTESSDSEDESKDDIDNNEIEYDSGIIPEKPTFYNTPFVAEQANKTNLPVDELEEK
ncbi:Pleckstrin domain-containing family F member 2-like protein [Dinothrombium tinctorium]|uniref:Pleckstrin domain-containing family F member 2-like protein n=1 Tax=Dinothrombium tinctorium TaxID=1965070 RepID=A0A443RKS4_9ACAR|nr:Pleckstrin domain-containing family F member 2-like protein [Dinothrombium tinctorium]